MMRIRLPFAVVFFVLLALAGYAGLTSLQLDHLVNDKVLHAVTFFVLTIAFYWIIDTTRRRTTNLALVVCTAGLGVGSEVLQGALPNGRVFDVLDIAANIAGSLGAVGLCSWYHKRMLERKRLRRYTAVPGEEVDEHEVDEQVDVELGTVSHARPLHDDEPAKTTPTSISTPAPAPAPAPTRTRSLEDEVDNWDENAEDAWDDEDDGDDGDMGAPSKSRTD